MRRPPFVLVVLVSLVLLAIAPRARAAWPADPVTAGALEEREMVVQGGDRSAAGEARGSSWVTLAAFERDFTWRRDVGVYAVIGVALDRIAAGPQHAIADRPGPPAPAAPDPAPRPLVVDARLARGAVAAAWRAAGLGVDDAKIDAIIARARLSAALPETRLRAMRLVDDEGRTDTTPATDAVRYYDYGGVRLWLEARLTWRLDRLLYADDEPTLERVRLERIDARARVTAKILELVFQWQRAVLDARDAPAGSREELDATLRTAEAEIALDVLTAGWFAKASRARPPEPPAGDANGEAKTEEKEGRR